MVAFDNNNHRIGKGGGYYDRYLQNNISAIRIGIAFQEQKMINLIPNNRFDKKINFFITD
jgi:5-formyltetrahydrofolate cyclo-ligase